MKQANHAPQPLWRRRLPGYAAMGAATLAMALGLHGLMSARTTVAGTLLPLADADAATYGIRAVYQLDENTYYVVGAQKGFQSDVEAGVTLDSTGNVQSVAILAQGETDTLGAQCVNPEFTSRPPARAMPPQAAAKQKPPQRILTRPTGGSAMLPRRPRPPVRCTRRASRSRL